MGASCLEIEGFRQPRSRQEHPHDGTGDKPVASAHDRRHGDPQVRAEDPATALAREITEMTWARFFDGYELVHGLVAESNGALLGLTHYLFHRSTIAIEPACYLQDRLQAQ